MAMLVSGPNTFSSGLVATVTLTITKKGTQTVYVSLEWHGKNSDKLYFDYPTTTTMANMKGSIVLDVGETAVISFWIDSHGLSMDDKIIDSLTITATAAE